MSDANEIMLPNEPESIPVEYESLQECNVLGCVNTANHIVECKFHDHVIRDYLCNRCFTNYDNTESYEMILRPLTDLCPA